MSISCGIDFGTSNSALALASAHGVSLACVEGQDVTLPSAIFYPVHPPSPQFGRAAMHSFTAGEEGRFMRSLKRILGTTLMGQGTVVNGRTRKFEDILSDFIGHLKKTAESQVHTSLQSVVMGRPVHFVDHDPAANTTAQNALEKIARIAGFKHVEFQFEPIAAAFAHERQLTGEKLALVVDIGGGTSDFTVIRLSQDRWNKADRQDDILANTGVRVGGNDFDKDFCLSVFMSCLGYGTTWGPKHLTMPVSPFHEMSEWSKINFLYTPKTQTEMQGLYRQSHDPKKFGRFLKILKDETGHRLLSTVENTKIILTQATETNVLLDFIEDGLSVPTTKESFDDATQQHVLRINTHIQECLIQSGITAHQIELVILTGGTTEVPALKQAVKQQFPGASFSEDNKLSSVGLGLGYDSLRRFGS